ncbi:photosensitized INA-labeled protein PHIL1, putative (PHIL1) [Plasmodium ovale wallikeri]|uniref:Photosensitized INA-labeled protein PHIL1, putative n=2 Tax=Plasmodium ovale TaxID=36330 RepID=A0A1C3KMP9_PLAOA|nr:photosensitized INA-labeled protein PHIL1, putative (PHIL1) [Plasmodium ovale wallikeri]SBT31253.1 photosensitized INA-labeled protein PHIL1, putative (PHIL1) [Plasmodium ovale wallikeri]SBT75286.1 photosensitized INA-labeled protein PHIL1, putative [Plasmodium ovale]
MLSSVIPKRYSFDKKGTIKEINFLSCKSIISPKKHVDSKNNLTCTTSIFPNLYETTHDNITKMYVTQDNSYDNEGMSTNAYANQMPSMNNINVVQYDENQCNNLGDVNVHGMNEPLIFADDAQYCAEPVNGIDAGVVAVSNALFAYNSAFQCIPIKSSPNVFRRRTKGESNSEWSNAFVTRIDPCECAEPEEQFKPYEVTKYYDDGKVKTVFNFDQDSCKEAM